MKNIDFTVPYAIGTYLIKYKDGIEHLDQVNRYVIDEKGISVILMLDVETDPRLSTAISVEDLLRNWKKDTDIHLSGDIGNKLHIGMQFEEEPIIVDGPLKKLNIKDSKNKSYGKSI